jgi:hypothetical protein
MHGARHLANTPHGLHISWLQWPSDQQRHPAWHNLLSISGGICLTPGHRPAGEQPPAGHVRASRSATLNGRRPAVTACWNAARVAMLGILRRDRSPRSSPAEPCLVHGRLLVGVVIWSTAQVPAHRSGKAKLICPVPRARSRRCPLLSAPVGSARSSIRLRGYGPGAGRSSWRCPGSDRAGTQDRPPGQSGRAAGSRISVDMCQPRVCARGGGT